MRSKADRTAASFATAACSGGKDAMRAFSRSRSFAFRLAGP